MTTWNYRVGTYLFSYKKNFKDNKKLSKLKDERLFCIISVNIFINLLVF